MSILVANSICVAFDAHVAVWCTVATLLPGFLHLTWDHACGLNTLLRVGAVVVKHTESAHYCLLGGETMAFVDGSERELKLRSKLSRLFSSYREVTRDCSPAPPGSPSRLYSFRERGGLNVQ